MNNHEVKNIYYIVQGRREEDGKIFFYSNKTIVDSEKDAIHFTDKPKADMAKSLLDKKTKTLAWKVIKVTQSLHYEIY